MENGKLRQPEGQVGHGGHEANAGATEQGGEQHCRQLAAGGQLHQAEAREGGHRHGGLEQPRHDGQQQTHHDTHQVNQSRHGVVRGLEQAGGKVGSGLHSSALALVDPWSRPMGHAQLLTQGHWFA